MPAKKEREITATGDIETFMKQLDHPHKAGINRLRSVIKDLDPRIEEEIKWNAPSFKINDHFATFKLHPAKNIQLVLHTGAKPQNPQRAFLLDGPAHVLKWPAIDRCVITVQSSEEAEELEDAIADMVKQWIQQLDLRS